ncbi:MAG: type transport system permease protein [Thermoleophilaceae bacterium]|jgi:ABC-2 type transport system permease protein|nr:type transport system permease protein [Thermoleophilaceae bacterium]
MRWLFAKDLRILARSPLLVGLLVVYPIVIAALVGFAVTSGPSKPRVAVLNEVPQSANSISLGGQQVNVAKEAKPLFDAITPVYVQTRDEAIKKVRDGDVLGALILPPDITQNLEAATSGGGKPARVEVFYNAEDPAKQRFVENTIKARVQDANSALAKKFTKVAADYIKLLSTGGHVALLNKSFDVLGLQNSETILRGAAAAAPKERKALTQVADFAHVAQQNLGLADTVLQAVGTPIVVDTTIVKGGKTPLGSFAAAIAVTVTLMFVTLLLAAGALALEREENAFRRLVRGLVSRTGLLVEKVALAAACSVAVTLLLLFGLSLFVSLPWGRFGLWVAALALGAAAFGALGVAMGAAAREVRAASLLAFMASLPIAVLGLVPSGAVSSGLYEVVRVVSAVFPFKPSLDALKSALSQSGAIGGPLLHLALLAVAYTLVARLLVRRFA